MKGEISDVLNANINSVNDQNQIWFFEVRVWIQFLLEHIVGEKPGSY